MKFTVLAFNVEWYDSNAQMVRHYRLNCYNDETLELINLATKQNFLKRIHYPSVQPTDLFIGATINVFSRKLQIVDFADLGTKKVIEGATSRAVGCVGLPDASAVGYILDTIMLKFRVTAAKTVFADDVGMRSPSGLALVVEAVTHSNEGVEILGELLAALEADGLVSSFTLPTAPEEVAQSALDLFHGTIHNSAVNNDAVTLCIVKPHLVKELTLGSLVADVTGAGFEVKALEMFVLDMASATEFYDVYKGVITEYTDAVDQLIKGPCIAMQICAPANTVESFREFCGPTDVAIAKHLRPESLRAKYGSTRVQNAVHCTDLPEDGLMECKYFFNTLADKPPAITYAGH